MKKSTQLFCVFLLTLFCLGQTYAQFKIPAVPTKQTSLYDYANLLTPQQAQQLEHKLLRYSDSTSTQIVVVITPTIENEDIGILTPKWAHEWGIGQEKEDNGVLMLMAVKERRIHISPGYGAEVRMTAGRIGELTRTVIIPEFKANRYYEGLDKGADGIFKMLNGEFKGKPKSKGDGGGLLSLLPFLFFIVILIIIASKNKGGGQGGGRNGGNRSGGLDLTDMIILSSLGRGGRSSGGFGGGGFGGGFGGGGFGGGFGGGGFSGGGAGGSW